METSCGLILRNGDLILLLRYPQGHWGFPKGHVEENDLSHQATAIRELEEETGITDVEIIGKTGARYSDYSLNFREHISADGRIQYAPNDVIYELKYPNLDIKGTIK